MSFLNVNEELGRIYKKDTQKQPWEFTLMLRLRKVRKVIIRNRLVKKSDNKEC